MKDKKRVWPWIVLLAVVGVVGAGGASAYFLVGRDYLAPVPPLWKELPDGEVAGWYGREELKRSKQGERPDALPAYKEAEEYAVLHTADGFVQILKGKFDLARQEEYFARYANREKVDGYDLWIPWTGLRGSLEHWATYEAAHVTADRIVVGSKKLVIAALQVRAGKAKSFASTLTLGEKSGIRASRWKSMLLLARMRDAAKSEKLRETTNWFLEGDASGVVWMTVGQELEGGNLVTRMTVRHKSSNAAKKSDGDFEKKARDKPDFVKILRREVTGDRFVLEVSVPQDKAR